MKKFITFCKNELGLNRNPFNFQKISKFDPKKIHATDRAGMSALHCAVAVGSVSYFVMRFVVHIKFKATLILLL